MDIVKLRQINGLWNNIYPYLASQVMDTYKNDTGKVLEIGPFSGGISRELARLYPGLEIVIADNSPQVIKYLKEEVSNSGLSGRIDVRVTDPANLIFADGSFDLVICRGYLFFINFGEQLLREVYRVVKKDGLGYVGGGYGSGCPGELKDGIGEESRELNESLGRKHLSLQDIAKLVKGAGLESKCSIEEDGGVWLNIRK
ncbi:MAG: class I SAM-dependent methyltransferase [Dehalococcoidia bacterium]|nr:class I SAM-dependent methyltransferase [Dehalococcoidia bacterium]